MIPVPLIQGGHLTTQDLRRRIKIIPVNVGDSPIRIKPMALASGHGRYITVISTPERTTVSVGKYLVNGH
jgi:hypothetical protein